MIIDQAARPVRLSRPAPVRGSWDEALFETWTPRTLLVTAVVVARRAVVVT